MNIRFISTLTPDDEDVIASALMTAAKAILDVLPIAYVIRIDTSGARVFEHSAPKSGSRGAAEATMEDPLF